ncbi:MAG: hypothetical protein FWB71_05950, partial [Defluviitaleaceae bacterium]|nr:hypothetical protein [Defluviitaleaceae bacterium]
MEEKPRNAKDPRGPSKGFLIATYSALGIMLIFAVALGYRHFVSPSGEHSQIAQTIPGHADFESLPVGNFYQDMPMDFGMTADAWARAATAPPRPAPTTAPAAGMATAITTPPPT